MKKYYRILVSYFNFLVIVVMVIIYSFKEKFYNLEGKGFIFLGILFLAIGIINLLRTSTEKFKANYKNLKKINLLNLVISVILIVFLEIINNTHNNYGIATETEEGYYIINHSKKIFQLTIEEYQSMKFLDHFHILLFGFFVFEVSVLFTNKSFKK